MTVHWLICITRNFPTLKVCWNEAERYTIESHNPPGFQLGQGCWSPLSYDPLSPRQASIPSLRGRCIWVLCSATTVNIIIFSVCAELLKATPWFICLPQFCEVGVTTRSSGPKVMVKKPELNAEMLVNGSGPMSQDRNPGLQFQVLCSVGLPFKIWSQQVPAQQPQVLPVCSFCPLLA